MRNPAVAGGARGDDRAGTSTSSIAAVEQYLCGLIARCADEVPLIDQLREADLATPRATASIARAALSVLRSKDPAVIRADVERELAEIDLLCRWRIRQAGLDVHGRGDTDWSRIHEVVTARAEYRKRWGVAC
jgi:hypothetical protein